MKLFVEGLHSELNNSMQLNTAAMIGGEPWSTYLRFKHSTNAESTVHTV